MPKLSVIICCYNEHSTILDVVARTKDVDLGPGWSREILVIDNCSTDGTRELLQNLNDSAVRTIFHDQNMGKGMSIRTGIANMTGDYMIIQDADAEYDPAEHARFVQVADKTKAAAIFGSRVLGGDVKYEYARAYLGVRFLTLMTNLLFGGRLTDVATATKMVRADVVQALNLTTTDFNLDFELPDKILLSGHQILEIPISYDPRTYAEGKKITSMDGLRALKTMIRDRLGLTPVLRPAEEQGREPLPE
ncbi:MAG: glycosyltransferase family 2 protein [Candidatus Promineifilaceae bacterium]|jgi:dolichol-phosphate mannosyltransferase